MNVITGERDTHTENSHCIYDRLDSGWLDWTQIVDVRSKDG
jgi:hypothetical protein